MAIKNRDLTVKLLVWDTVANRGKTGDAGNITLYVAKDDDPVAPVVGAVTEVSAANMPGVYKVTLTAAEMDGDFICVSGTSSSQGVVVYPAPIQTEQGDISEISGLLSQIVNALPNLATKSDLSNLAKTSDVTNILTAISGVNSSINGDDGVMAKLDDIFTAVSTVSGYFEGEDGVTDRLSDIFTDVSDIHESFYDDDGVMARLSGIAGAVNVINRDGVKLDEIGINDVKTGVAEFVNGTRLDELGATPVHENPTLREAVVLPYMALRNKTVNTDSAMIIYKSDNITEVSRAALEDVDNIFTKHKLS